MQKITLILLFLSVSLHSLPQIAMDGLFSDWDNYQSYNNDHGFVKQFSITDGENNLYFSFETNDFFKLNEEESILLLIDYDNDTSTGTSQYGYDLCWDFSMKTGYLYKDDTSFAISFADIDFFYLPTVTSNKYEITICKDFSLNNVNYTFSNSIKVSILSGWQNISLFSPVEYHFVSEKSFEYNPKLSKSNKKAIRVMNYNTLHDGILKEEKQLNFIKIIQNLNPDIITFNECWTTSADTISKLFIHYFPESNWYVTKKDEGNITISKFPIINSVNIIDNHRITANFIQFQDNEQVLIINSHLTCCNNDDDRMKEVIAMNNYIENLKKSNQDDFPIIIIGDLNLVGNKEQLEILTNGINNGPDWDNSPLTDLITFQVNSNYSHTWYDENSNYSPGRLDFIIYTDTRLEPLNSFIFRSEFLTDKQLSKFEISKNLTETTSDHFPIIADFLIINE